MRIRHAMRRDLSQKKRPVRLTAKQAPHRPDTAPAHGLRAEMAASHDTADPKETDDFWTKDLRLYIVREVADPTRPGRAAAHQQLSPSEMPNSEKTVLRSIRSYAEPYTQGGGGA